MRRNRPYKKGTPFRDARLFIVACEGEKREKEYFEHLGQGSQRIKIKILAAQAGDSLSAPKWVVDRLVHFIEKERISINTGDQIWLIMDVDRWQEEQLFKIAAICRDHKWGFALSNPCFEAWLLFHVQNEPSPTSSTCQEYKRELDRTVRGGYRPDNFIPLAANAISTCKQLDSHPDSPIPPHKLSRVYLAVEEILHAL